MPENILRPFRKAQMSPKPFQVSPLALRTVGQRRSRPLRDLSHSTAFADSATVRRWPILVASPFTTAVRAFKSMSAQLTATGLRFWWIASSGRIPAKSPHTSHASARGAFSRVQCSADSACATVRICGVRRVMRTRSNRSHGLSVSHPRRAPKANNADSLPMLLALVLGASFRPANHASRSSTVIELKAREPYTRLSAA